MIRIVCSNCQSKLNAKDELVGQTRNCPKCGTPVLIAASVLQPADGPSATTSAPASSEGDFEGEIAAPQIPEQLDRTHRYVICDRQRVVATWENNGQGWLVCAQRGFISARRSEANIPIEGDYRLVELKMAEQGSDLRLVGLHVYQLTRRYALQNLARGDDAILKAVTGPGSLWRDQKNVVRQHLRDHFMPEVWQDSQTVADYLANDDYHSPGVDGAA